MADVSISSLTQGIPAGSNVVPYSTGSNTLGVPVSAILQNAGNIGIGTNNPELTLDLTNTSDTGERAIRILNGSLRDLLIGVEGSSANRFSGSSINNAFVGSSSSAGLELATNNSVRMYINSDGNVGIGTTTPASKLHVNGTITATGLQVPGAVIQVTSAIKTDISVTTSTTFVDIPGLAASITPRSVSSKILFTGNVFGSCANNAFVRIMRSIGGAAYSQVYTSTSTVGNRTPVSFGDFYMTGGPGTGAGKQNTSIFLDTTTNTTSEIIYKLQYKATVANYPFTINSTYYDADAYYQAIGASSVTLMEIAG